MPTRLLLALTVSMLALAACDGDSGAKGPDTKDPETTTWKADILPMLGKYCVACHQATGCPSGVCFLAEGTDLGANAVDTAACPDLSLAECMVARIEDGSMPTGGCPPGETGCITLDEMAKLKAWADAGAP